MRLILLGSLLGSLFPLILTSKLHISGDTASIVFNEYGPLAQSGEVRPIEMVAENGHLNLSHVMIAADVMTSDGGSLSVMADALDILCRRQHACQPRAKANAPPRVAFIAPRDITLLQVGDYSLWPDDEAYHPVYRRNVSAWLLDVPTTCSRSGIEEPCATFFSQHPGLFTCLWPACGKAAQRNSRPVRAGCARRRWTSTPVTAP